MFTLTRTIERKDKVKLYLWMFTKQQLVAMAISIAFAFSLSWFIHNYGQVVVFAVQYKPSVEKLMIRTVQAQDEILTTPKE